MTKQEAQELLNAVSAKLKAQGGVVDARLLDKKGNLEKLVASFSYVSVCECIAANRPNYYIVATKPFKGITIATCETLEEANRIAERHNREVAAAA